MTSKDIKFSKDSLELIKNGKAKSIERLAQDMNDVLMEASAAAGDIDPGFILAWMQPVFNQIKEEDQFKEFLKLVLTYFRYASQLQRMRSEMSALELLLDDKGMLTMAAVNFDDLEVIEDSES